MALNTWMGDKFGAQRNTKLSQITMPGSHDAGMYEAMNSSGKGKILTQFDSIGTQLNNGTRFFDIRVYFKKKIPRIGHFASKSTSSAFGGYGPPLEDMMTEMQSFVTNNPSEFIIVKMALSGDARQKKGGGWPAVSGKIPWIKLWPPRTPANYHIAGLTYNDAKGHIFMCFEKDHAPKDKHLTALRHYQKVLFIEKVGYTEPISPLALPDRGTLHLAGSAPTKNKLGDVLKKQKKKIQSGQHTNTHNRLNLFYLTITSAKNTVEDNTIRELKTVGSNRNPTVTTKTKRSGWSASFGLYNEKINEALRWKNGYKPNIIHYDFVNSVVNQHIVDLNN